MRNRPDTPEGVKEIRLRLQGDRIFYSRESPNFKRTMMLYLDTLTAEQRQKVLEAEAVLLEFAEDADEETRTVLKGK